MREVVERKRTLDSVPSYMGHLKYLNSFNAIKKIYDAAGWDYQDDDLFRAPFQKTRKTHQNDEFF